MPGLSAFQYALLRALETSEVGCVLFGGGAVLHRARDYRSTRDLDLSLIGEVPFDHQAKEVLRALEGVGTVNLMLRTPAFRRVRVSDRAGTETCIVDLVHDGSMRWAELTPIRPGSSILVPPIDYLLADKILALLGRKEIRDLADAFVLLRSGARIGISWSIARGQDPGLDSATLGWVLDDWDLAELCRASTIDPDVLGELPEFRIWFQRWLIEHTSIDLDEI